MPQFGPSQTLPLQTTKLPSGASRTTAFRGAIRQLEFAPDGRLLALTGLGVEIYEPSTLELVDTWLPETNVASMQTFDGEVILVAHEGDEHRFHRAKVGDDLGEAFARTTYTAWTDIPLRSRAAAGLIAIPDGTGLTVVSLDGAEVLSVQFDEEFIDDIYYTPNIHQAVVSPDGTYVIGVSRGRAGVVWKIETGEVVLQTKSFDAPQSVCFLPDGRVVFEGGGTIYDLKDGSSQYGVFSDQGPLGVHGDRVVSFEVFGYTEISYEDDSVGEHTQTVETHYGTMPPTNVGAVGAEGVAKFEATYGRLVMFGAEVVERDGFLGQPEMLSVSGDGRRAAILSAFRNTALAVDLGAETVREFSDEVGLQAPGVSADGSTLIVPAGPNRKVRQIFTAGFDAEAFDPGQKVFNWVRRIEGFGTETYAVDTYKDGGAGYVGIYKQGQKRALTKITVEKYDPFEFALNREGTRALVTWRNPESWEMQCATLHDLESKGAELRRIEIPPGAPRREGTPIAMGSGESFAYVAMIDDEPRLRVAIEGSELTEVPLATATPRVAMSADNAKVYVGHLDGVLEVFATDDGTSLSRTPMHAGSFLHLTFAGPDLVSLGDDGFLRVLHDVA